VTNAGADPAAAGGAQAPASTGGQSSFNLDQNSLGGSQFNQAQLDGASMQSGAGAGAAAGSIIPGISNGQLLSTGLTAASIASQKGGSTGGAGANMYVPTGLSGADTGWQGANQANTNTLNYNGGLSNTTNPLYAQTLQQQQAINYQPYLNASQTAGQQYGQLGQAAQQSGNTMMGQAGQNFGQQQNLQGMGNQLWNTAADPQQALYHQQYQQTMDQANAVNSMYGLGSSGAGAGMAQQAGNNFNLGWQQNQLQRQLQGAQGAASLNQAGNQSGTLGSADMQAGMGYYGQMPGYTQQSAGVPMNAQQYVAGMPGQNATQYSQGMANSMVPYNQFQNQATQYMGYGSNAGSQAFQNTLDQNNQQNKFAGQLGNTLGQINWGAIGQQPQQQLQQPTYGGGSYGNYLDPYTIGGGP
jgi:hypothetical protein